VVKNSPMILCQRLEHMISRFGKNHWNRMSSR